MGASASSNATAAVALSEYYKCSKLNESTLLLPFLNESTIPYGSRVVMYFIALLWMFMGVAIGAGTYVFKKKRRRFQPYQIQLFARIYADHEFAHLTSILIQIDCKKSRFLTCSKVLLLLNTV